MSSSPRGISHEARKPIPIPNANPSVTSWRTNSYQTKSSSPAARAALKASTAGSASPSFMPDSRLSEWRTSRGTRGLVTTLEESTGSVGESSAPSRNDSVHDRSVRAWATSAIRTQVIGMARISLRAGSRHSRWSISASTSMPSRNRITISATVASWTTKPDSASNSSTSRPPSPSTKPATTNTAVIDRKLRCARPEASAPPISSAPKTSAATSNSSIAGEGFHRLGPCASPTPPRNRSGSTGRGPRRLPRWRDRWRPTWRSSAPASRGYGPR